jgi:hypothetical protein
MLSSRRRRGRLLDAAATASSFVCRRADGNAFASHDCVMGNDWPTPWNDPVVCAVCGRRLLPLSFSPASIDDESLGVVNRPDLKCPRCGQCYMWQDSAGWGPAPSVELQGRQREGVWSRSAPSRARSAPHPASRQLPHSSAADEVSDRKHPTPG